MSGKPRVVQLRLADGSALSAVEIPTATSVDTKGELLGVDYWGGRVGDGVTVLLVGTDDLAAATGLVRPGEEPTT